MPYLVVVEHTIFRPIQDEDVAIAPYMRLMVRDEKPFNI